MLEPFLPGGMMLDIAVRAATEIAVSAGDNISERNFLNVREGAHAVCAIKDGNHHAIVTETDVLAQEYILHYLAREFPKAHFVAEETTERFANTLVTDAQLGAVREGLVFGIDPIDGTAQFAHGLYEWSVSVGVMRNGKHIGGAIVAPQVLGGFVMFGDLHHGAWRIGSKTILPASTSVQTRKTADNVILTGVSMFHRPQFSKFLLNVAQEARSVNSCGSCALGMALVAAGYADAFVQTLQMPWDWFAGYPLVEAAGGKVQFYHYADRGNDRINGEIVLLEKPDLLSYSSKQKNVAFIAGAPDTVDWLFALLQKNWQT